MKVVLELNVEQTVAVDFIADMADRAMKAITGTGGPPVYPRLLVELGPNYLEIPLHRDYGARASKAV